MSLTQLPRPCDAQLCAGIGCCESFTFHAGPICSEPQNRTTVTGGVLHQNTKRRQESVTWKPILKTRERKKRSLLSHTRKKHRSCFQRKLLQGSFNASCDFFITTLQIKEKVSGQKGNDRSFLWCPTNGQPECQILVLVCPVNHDAIAARILIVSIAGSTLLIGLETEWPFKSPATKEST